VLLVNSTLPANSVGELIALAKREPGKINYASTSTGGSPHLSGELLNAMAGTTMQHVPYKGAAPAMTDLLAGQVNLMFDNLPSALAQIQAGKVKALAVTSIKRASVLPAVPTVRESGCPDTKSIRGRPAGASGHAAGARAPDPAGGRQSAGDA
jgi:tripartite-type tricarboxylate transporter receptor subunit TctC